MPLGTVVSGDDSVAVDYEIGSGQRSGIPVVSGTVKFLETIPYNIDAILTDVGAADLVLEDGTKRHIEFEDFHPLEMFATFLA